MAQQTDAPDLGWVVVGDYGIGEEVVMFCETRAEANQILEDYRRSVAGVPHRVRKERNSD